MENPIHISEHNYCRRKRSSPRQRSAGCIKCPHCRNDQDILNSSSQQSAATPQKRKQRSPSSVRPPRKLFRRSRSPIPLSKLPVVLDASRCVQPSSVVNNDSAVTIHNHSVEEYQKIYRQVVDDRLTDKNGHMSPYSLDLGRLLKQKLWEKLDRPTFTTSTAEDGLERVEVSYAVGDHPPLHHIDTSGEPEPQEKRARRQ